MFLKKKRKSMLGMDMDMDFDMASVLKAVAVGTVIYQAAKFMIHEMTDD
jgi:ribosome-associated toxin RatA of RatAB toxin-antitoxin module